jgi:AcrR family transcriptional regulator
MRQEYFVPIGSLSDNGPMGRPKNFSRKGVLEKALPVFWRRGFADASLHELEQATGVNKSGLYSEFEDKEDLFVQSLRYYLEGLEKMGLLTAEPLGWKNIERFLKMGPCSMEGQKGCFAVNSMREFAILPPEADYGRMLCSFRNSSSSSGPKSGRNRFPMTRVGA